MSYFDKSVLELPHANVGVPYADFKYCISQYILSTWQDDWNGAVMNKVHSVKPVLGDWQSSSRRCWRIKLYLVSCPHWSYSSNAFIRVF